MGTLLLVLPYLQLGTAKQGHRNGDLRAATRLPIAYLPCCFSFKARVVHNWALATRRIQCVYSDN